MRRGKIERETKGEKKKKIFAWKERKEESSNKDCHKREKREQPRKRAMYGE